jgi:hypothetical protein
MFTSLASRLGFLGVPKYSSFRHHASGEIAASSNALFAERKSKGRRRTASDGAFPPEARTALS